MPDIAISPSNRSGRRKKKFDAWNAPIEQPVTHARSRPDSLRTKGDTSSTTYWWYAFGEYDGYTLWEAPDNQSMAAVAIALGVGGALSKVETTVLMTVEETLGALTRAGSVGYRAPGS